MTATLTPAGVDSTTITDLEQHINDEPTCVCCGKPATVRLVLHCKRDHVLTCDRHHTAEEARINRELDRGVTWECLPCHAVFVSPATAADIFSAVIL